MTRKGIIIVVLVVAGIVALCLVALLVLRRADIPVKKLSGWEEATRSSFFAEWNASDQVISYGSPGEYMGFPRLDDLSLFTQDGILVLRFQQEHMGSLQGTLFAFTPSQGLYKMIFSGAPSDYRERSTLELIRLLTRENPAIWSRVLYSYKLGPPGTQPLHLPSVPEDPCPIYSLMFRD